MSFFKDKDWESLFSGCDNRFQVWLYLIKKTFQFGIMVVLTNSLNAVGISSVSMLIQSLG